MKEQFKAFVRKRPELVKFVNSGNMTWQKFYEQWSLYGEDDKVWDEYKTFNKETKSQENFNFSSLVDMVKKVDMDSVQKGVNGMQKAVELLQGLTTKSSVGNKAASTYKPRQLFKKFED